MPQAHGVVACTPLMVSCSSCSSLRVGLMSTSQLRNCCPSSLEWQCGAWQGLLVSCRCDNAAVVVIINSGRSKVERVMHLMRCLSFFLARWNVSLICRHIPDSQNVAADALSRNASRGKQDTNNPSRRITGVLGARNARLDQHRLDHHVQTFSLKGLVDSTQKVYHSGQKRYLNFCA